MANLISVFPDWRCIYVSSANYSVRTARHWGRPPRGPHPRQPSRACRKNGSAKAQSVWGPRRSASITAHLPPGLAWSTFIPCGPKHEQQPPRLSWPPPWWGNQQPLTPNVASLSEPEGVKCVQSSTASQRPGSRSKWLLQSLVRSTAVLLYVRSLIIGLLFQCHLKIQAWWQWSMCRNKVRGLLTAYFLINQSHLITLTKLGWN